MQSSDRLPYLLQGTCVEAIEIQSSFNFYSREIEDA